MNLRFEPFSENFIEFWTKNEKVELNGDERKILAGVNWLFEIKKQSFERFDKKFENLKEKTKNVTKANCGEIYDEIVKNSNFVEKNEKNFILINFKGFNVEQQIQNLKKYHKCKETNYDKFNLMKMIFAEKYTEWQQETNHCFKICRSKPLTALDENNISDCYCKCMKKAALELPKIEYYLTQAFNKLEKELDEGKIDIEKADVLHPYRFSRREYDDNTIRKYI